MLWKLSEECAVVNETCHAQIQSCSIFAEMDWFHGNYILKPSQHFSSMQYGKHQQNAYGLSSLKNWLDDSITDRGTVFLHCSISVQSLFSFVSFPIS